MRKINTFFAVIALFTVVACGKKVEPVAAPVNPQITDAVTQSTPPAEVLDAGVVQTVAPAPVSLPVK